MLQLPHNRMDAGWGFRGHPQDMPGIFFQESSDLKVWRDGKRAGDPTSEHHTVHILPATPR